MVVRVDESEKFLQFKNWFIENGGNVSDAYGLKNFQITGRGVVAKRDIKRGERIVEIPKKMQITAPWVLENCPQIHQFMKIADKRSGLKVRAMTLIFRGRNLSPLQISNETIDAWDVITLFLLFEKQNASESKFKLFIDFIPKEFTLPMAWPEGCSLFLPKQTRKEAFAQITDSKKRFLKILRIDSKHHYPFFPNLTFKEFIWSQCAITSRNVECERVFHRGVVPPFWLELKTPNDTSGIAPIFEMFNHSSENNAFFDFDMINKNLYVATREDISEGEQIFINYSDREDDEMLMHYGFSFPPGQNKYSFLAITTKEVQETIVFLLQNPETEIAKREKVERRRALKLQYDFLQVVRRLINLRLAEISDLDTAADRRKRIMNIDEELPMELADNIRMVHKHIGNSWLNRLENEMKKVTRVLEMEKEYEDNIFGNMPVFCNLSMATISSQSNIPSSESAPSVSSTLRSTFGSLSDLRKYHVAHGKPKDNPLETFKSSSNLLKALNETGEKSLGSSSFLPKFGRRFSVGAN